ncbi:hypothetical protein UlMin_018387 [Ulmus minor]
MAYPLVDFLAGPPPPLLLFFLLASKNRAGSTEESTVTEQSGGGRRKRRDEESEKPKAANKLEFMHKQEKLERKKAEYVEKMKNNIALIHKDVEEKRTVIEAKKDENVLKAEEMAAKYPVTGIAPKKLIGCF